MKKCFYTKHWFKAQFLRKIVFFLSEMLQEEVVVPFQTVTPCPLNLNRCPRPVSAHISMTPVLSPHPLSTPRMRFMTKKAPSTTMDTKQTNCHVFPIASCTYRDIQFFPLSSSCPFPFSLFQHLFSLYYSQKKYQYMT